MLNETAISYEDEGLKLCHTGHQCANCEEDDVEGDLFVCNTCDEEWCESCTMESMRNGGPVPHEHQMRRVMSGINRVANDIHEIPCTVCGSERYPGLRYTSEKDKDANLCELCYKRLEKGLASMKSHEPERRTGYRNCLARAVDFQNWFGASQSAREYEVYNAEDKDDLNSLARRIGFANYLNPEKEPEKDDQFGYGEEQDKEIRNLRDIVKRKTEEDGGNVLKVAFISVTYFVAHKMEDRMSLIKLYTGKSVFFIEQSGRVYHGWNAFLDNNRLPECEMVYPTFGEYTLDDAFRVKLSKRASPQCSSISKAAKTTDQVANAVGVVTTGVVLTSMLPFTPVLAGGAVVATTASMIGCAGWGLLRSVSVLGDRRKHDQSINPTKDKESFYSWLSVAGSVAAVGAAGCATRIASMAERGVSFGATTSVLANTAFVGNLSIQTIGTIANGANIVEKYRKGERPSSLEVFQLTTSVFFFSHGVKNFQTAGSMVKQIQEQAISDYRASGLTKRQDKRFRYNLNKDRRTAMARGEQPGAHTMGKIDNFRKTGEFGIPYGGTVPKKSANQTAHKDKSGHCTVPPRPHNHDEDTKAAEKDKC